MDAGTGKFPSDRGLFCRAACRYGWWATRAYCRMRNIVSLLR